MAHWYTQPFMWKTRSASTLNKALEEGRIEFVKNKYDKWIPYEKIYAPLSGEERTKKFTTWIDDIANGTEVLKSLFGKKSPFDYSKSPALINRFLKMAKIEDDSIILDFFSGSATTAHAVMQLNSEDGGRRKYICVQLPEPTPDHSEARRSGFANICEIGKERIRRAGEAIKQAHPEVDTGFRVFRLDSSNMQDVYFEPAKLRREMLFQAVENIKPDRSDLDLLFGCMLDWGVQLNSPLRKEEVGEHILYIVNDGELLACFDSNISFELLEKIASFEPLRVVFRERCFEQDKNKINLYEQLKQLCNWSNQEVYKRVRVV